MAFNPLQTQFGTHIEDNIRSGPMFDAVIQTPLAAGAAGPNTNPVSYETIGLPGSYNSPIHVMSLVPRATTPDSLLAAQIVGAAGNVNLRTNPPAASGVTVGYSEAGYDLWTFDTPRNVFMTGSAGATQVNAIIQGFDEYGFAMTEQMLTPNGNTRTNGIKAFKSIVSIYLAGSTTAQISIGNGDALGFPYFITDTDSLINIKWAGSDWLNGFNGGVSQYYYISAANDSIGKAVTPGLQVAGASSLNGAKLLIPSDAGTADVRGTINLFQPAVAGGTPQVGTVSSDGTRKLTVTIYVTGSDQIYLARNYPYTPPAGTIFNPAAGTTNIAISEINQTQELIGVPQYSAV